MLNLYFHVAAVGMLCCLLKGEENAFKKMPREREVEMDFEHCKWA